MTTYATTTTMNKKDATSYTSDLRHDPLDNSVIVSVPVVSDGAQPPKYSPIGKAYMSATAEENSPAGLTLPSAAGQTDTINNFTSAQMTSTVPRHGQNISGPKVLPPVFIRQAWNTPIQTKREITPTMGNRNRFLVGRDEEWATASNLWHLYAAIKSQSQSVSPMAKTSLEVLRAQLESPNLVLTTGGDISGTADGNYNGDCAISNLGQPDQTTTPIIFVNGNVAINADVRSPGIIVATGNITVTSTNTLAATPPMVLVGNQVYITSVSSVSNPNEEILPPGSLIVAKDLLTFAYTNGSVVPLATSTPYHGSATNTTGSIWGPGSPATAGNSPAKIATEEKVQNFSHSISNVVKRQPREVAYVDYWKVVGKYNESTGQFNANATHTDTGVLANLQNTDNTVNMGDAGASWADRDALMEVMLWIVCAQYGLCINGEIVNPTTPTGAYYVLNNNGSQEIRFIHDGIWREMYVVLEFVNPLTAIPNYGIHTEPFGLDEYVEENMLQTQRVMEDVFIPLNVGTDTKKYFLGCSCQFTSSGNDWKIRICPDANRLDLGAMPYSNATQQPTVPNTAEVTVYKFNGVSNSPTTFRIATSGLLTPIDSQNIDGGSVTFTDGVSKYVKLAPAANSFPKIRLFAPYSNFLRYAPLGGLVTSGSAGNVEVKNGMVMVKNPTKHATVIRANISITKTGGYQGPATTPELLENMNMMGPVQGKDRFMVVYADTTQLHYWKRALDSRGKIYIVDAGASADLNGVIYTVHNDGISAVVNGLGSSPINMNLVALADQDYELEVYFGDVISESPFKRTAVDNNEFKFFEAFEYFAKGLDALYHYYLNDSLHVLGNTNTVDLSMRTAEEIAAIRISGFQVNDITKVATRFSRNNEPRIVQQAGSPDFVVFGRRTFYFTEGSETADVPVIPGTYLDTIKGTNIAVYAGGKIFPSDLVRDEENNIVFNIANYTFVGIETPAIPEPPAPAVQHYEEVDGGSLDEFNSVIFEAQQNAPHDGVRIIHAKGIQWSPVLVPGSKIRVSQFEFIPGYTSRDIMYTVGTNTYMWKNMVE